MADPSTNTPPHSIGSPSRTVGASSDLEDGEIVKGNDERRSRYMDRANTDSTDDERDVEDRAFLHCHGRDQPCLEHDRCASYSYEYYLRSKKRASINGADDEPDAKRYHTSSNSDGAKKRAEDVLWGNSPSREFVDWELSEELSPTPPPRDLEPQPTQGCLGPSVGEQNGEECTPISPPDTDWSRFTRDGSPSEVGRAVNRDYIKLVKVPHLGALYQWVRGIDEGPRRRDGRECPDVIVSYSDVTPEQDAGQHTDGEQEEHEEAKPDKRLDGNDEDSNAFHSDRWDHGNNSDSDQCVHGNHAKNCNHCKIHKAAMEWRKERSRKQRETDQKRQQEEADRAYEANITVPIPTIAGMLNRIREFKGKLHHINSLLPTELSPPESPKREDISPIDPDETLGRGVGSDNHDGLPSPEDSPAKAFEEQPCFQRDAETEPLPTLPTPPEQIDPVDMHTPADTSRRTAIPCNNPDPGTGLSETIREDRDRDT